MLVTNISFKNPLSDYSLNLKSVGIDLENSTYSIIHNWRPLFPKEKAIEASRSNFGIKYPSFK